MCLDRYNGVPCLSNFLFSTLGSSILSLLSNCHGFYRRRSLSIASACRMVLFSEHTTKVEASFAASVAVFHRNKLAIYISRMSRSRSSWLLAKLVRWPTVTSSRHAVSALHARAATDWLRMFLRSSALIRHFKSLRTLPLRFANITSCFYTNHRAAPRTQSHIFWRSS